MIVEENLFGKAAKLFVEAQDRGRELVGRMKALARSESAIFEVLSAQEKVEDPSKNVLG